LDGGAATGGGAAFLDRRARRAPPKPAARAPPMDPIYLEGSGAALVNVHPLPIFSILDHHGRRDAGQERVLGALLGHVHNGVVEVTDAFGVYHEQVYDAETGAGEILVRRTSLFQMLELHRKVNPRESVVGWYSTDAGGGVAAGGAAGAPAAKRTDEFTIVVHEFFQQAAGAGAAPVHLLVDVSLRTQSVGLYAHRSVNNALLKK